MSVRLCGDLYVILIFNYRCYQLKYVNRYLLDLYLTYCGKYVRKIGLKLNEYNKELKDVQRLISDIYPKLEMIHLSVLDDTRMWSRIIIWSLLNTKTVKCVIWKLKIRRNYISYNAYKVLFMQITSIISHDSRYIVHILQDNDDGSFEKKFQYYDMFVQELVLLSIALRSQYIVVVRNKKHYQHHRDPHLRDVLPCLYTQLWARQQFLDVKKKKHIILSYTDLTRLQNAQMKTWNAKIIYDHLCNDESSPFRGYNNRL